MNNVLEQNIKFEYANKVEQVDASVRFVFINEKLYYDAQQGLPEKVKNAILYMVADINFDNYKGYHFRVLKAALNQYKNGSGFLDAKEPPFTQMDLYPENYQT